MPLFDPARAPRGPFLPEFWRSPLRGPWLTSVFSAALLVSLPLIAATGFLSNAAYNPRLAANSVGRPIGTLDFYLFPWPTHPAWLYAATQGLHVTLGLAVFPILLAKLWSVIPKLFEWPPVRTPAHALERLSLALLVGGALFEFATGILDIQYAYLFNFFFTDAHYYGAWVFTAAFVFHVALKFSTMRSSLAERHALEPIIDDLAATQPEASDSHLVAPEPAPASMSRRALLGAIGGSSLFLLLQGAGDSIGGPLRALSLFGPRDRAGNGPNGFQVNRTAHTAQIAAGDVDASWRLTLRGPSRTMDVSRAQLLQMPQYTHRLPIACVEGWTTTQSWTGVRVRDLAALVGAAGKLTLEAESVEQNGIFSAAALGSGQIADERTLLALRVNGVDLSLDHGFPARIIAPALPGVHCTKWVSKMTFRRAQER